MKYTYDLVNEGTVGESSTVCPAGHYNEEFLYGYTILTICGESWMFSYHETLEDSMARQKSVRSVIEKHRMPTLEEILARTSFLDLIPDSV